MGRGRTHLDDELDFEQDMGLVRTSGGGACTKPSPSYNDQQYVNSHHHRRVVGRAVVNGKGTSITYLPPPKPSRAYKPGK